MIMEKPNFKQLCDSFRQTTCVVSVEKKENGYGEIRIVEGNEAYRHSFQGDFYKDHEFVPNQIYTKYLQKNLNFEEYSYRAAIKKELLHSYGYPEGLQAWLHMMFLPIDYETDTLAYCLYVMDINEIYDPESLSNLRGDIYGKVLNTTLQLSNTGDFDTALKNVTREIRQICNALFCCILLVDDDKKELNILAEDREPYSDKKEMKQYMGDDFYDIVKTWDAVVASNGNCVIINNREGMKYVKEKSPVWYDSLIEANVHSLVLYRLKSGDEHLGYMWVSDFKSDDTPKIKDALEITTFVLGAQIGNHLLLDKLTKLSSIDFLTGLYNRNRLNSYMNEIAESPDTPTTLIFLDINGLKNVNDNEGHLAGDNLIRRAANTLIGVFSEHDIFRVGGDEFVVILRNTDEKHISEYIEKLHKRARKNYVSFAVGYATTNSSNEIEKILKEADANMYEDKRKFYRK